MSEKTVKGLSSLRTSIVVDPADGRLPALTQEGRTRAEQRADEPKQSGIYDSAQTRGDVFQATAGVTSSSGDFDWTWVGYGAGMALLLAAAMGALYLSARHRGRIALP